MIFQMMRGYHLTLAVILSVFGVGQMTEEFDFDEEMKRLHDLDEETYPNFEEEPKYLQDEEEYPNFDDGYVSLGQLFPKRTEC